MKFAVPPALGDTDRLFRRPPFPPPAHRCALTWVLSSATCSGGSGDPATVSKICCQIPRPLQRLKRLYTVVYGPYSGGQSCQRHPVLRNPSQCGHRFRRKAVTQSDRKRPPNRNEGGHPC